MLCPEQYYNYKLVGLNANWRFYKYTVGRFLPIHVDKSVRALASPYYFDT